ncbi:hypothetical protein GCM10009646_46210 [Streptomyces aureus]
MATFDSAPATDRSIEPPSLNGPWPRSETMVSPKVSTSTGDVRGEATGETAGKGLAP